MNGEFLLKDWIILVVGVIVTIVWPIILYMLRPNLNIKSVEKIDDIFKIKVINIGCFDAVNLNIEACLVNFEDDTKHLKFDLEDFIILPHKTLKSDQDGVRYFKIKNFDYALENYKSLRVRVHAFHSYSGFGKAFESKFECRDGKFKKNDKK